MELMEAEKMALDQVAAINIKENVALRAQNIILIDELKKLNAEIAALKDQSSTDSA